MDKNFWYNKRVLVTGHTGFKGTWLAYQLIKLGARVTGLSYQQDNREAIYHTTKLCNYVEDEFFFDIGVSAVCEELLKGYEFDVIFHLAAQSLVLESYKDPIKTYRTNVLGTLNILEYFRRSKQAKVCLVVTSDKCYENQEQKKGATKAFVESDPMGGADLYSSSKGCCELLVSSYRHSFFKNLTWKSLATARAGNVIGGGDFAANRLVPDCIRALRKNKEIVLRHPEAVRPWQHVLEATSGYILLAEKMGQAPQEYAGAWNFGPDAMVAVEDVVKEVIRVYGSGNYRVEQGKTPYEAGSLRLDATKAKTLLGWIPRFMLEEAIALTVEWYKTPKKEQYALTQKQIEDYIKRVQR